MIVIPMAGNSRRFTQAGYTVPKYMLPLEGRSLFAHAVGSFASLFAQEQFLFILRDQLGGEAFVRGELARLGVVDAQLAMLAHPTRGQAHTVELGLRAVAASPETPLTIFNIDTFRPGYATPDAPWAASADGWLEVMRADDPALSYIAPHPTKPDGVAETAEKRVLSAWASTGIYGFRRAADFLAAAAVSEEVAGELYVAPLYNDLIRRGLDVRYRSVTRDSVVFCGTPEQYRALGGGAPQ